METKALLSRNTTEINDKSKEKESNNGDDLDRGEHELGFSVYAYGEDVEADNKDDDDSDPDSSQGALIGFPISDDESGGRYLSTQCDGARVPVVPSNGKTKSRVDITGAILWDGTRKRQPGGHFT